MSEPTEHVSGLTDVQLKIKLESILGCYGEMCWPCSHWGKVEQLMELIKAVREGK